MKSQCAKLAILGVFLSLSLLSLATTPQVELHANNSDISILGSEIYKIKALATGDINGDEIDDIIMRGGPKSGTLLVVFGKGDLPREIDLSQTEPDLVVTNISPGTRFLQNVTVGDINGDSIGELLVSVREGVHIFWGRKEWPSRIDEEETSPDLRVFFGLESEQSERSFGFSISGDINNDGIDDLLISHSILPRRSKGSLTPPEVQKVYLQDVAFVLLGRKTWPHSINFTKQKPDLVIVAEQPKPHYHRIRQFKIGDLNGDGFGDIVAGTWDDTSGVLDPTIDALWRRAWIIMGSAELPSKVELKLSHTWPVRPKGEKLSKVIRLDPTRLDMVIGGGLAVGDMTGDGKAELILGLVKRGPDKLTSVRRFCLLNWNSELFSSLSNLDLKQKCIMIVGGTVFERADALFSPRPVLGDFNGDGLKDLFLVSGRPEFSFLGLFGRKTFLTPINIETLSDLKIKTPTTELGRGGYGLDRAMGDFNGDSREDLLILDIFGAGKGKKHGPGGAHVILGRRSVDS